MARIGSETEWWKYVVCDEKGKPRLREDAPESVKKEWKEMKHERSIERLRSLRIE